MGYDSNPDWYRAKHALAAEYVSWAAGENDAEAMPLLDRAEQRTLELLRQVEATLGDRLWGRQARNAEVRALRSFIAKDIAPTARVLLAQIEVAKQLRQAGGGTEEQAAAVRKISRESSDSPDVNYGLARFYAQLAALEPAIESLQIVVEGTSQPAWQGLAHKIARDPVLAEVVELPDFQPTEGFSPYLQKALSAVQRSAEESQGLD